MRTSRRVHPTIDDDLDPSPPLPTSSLEIPNACTALPYDAQTSAIPMMDANSQAMRSLDQSCESTETKSELCKLPCMNDFVSSTSGASTMVQDYLVVDAEQSSPRHHEATPPNLPKIEASKLCNQHQRNNSRRKYSLRRMLGELNTADAMEKALHRLGSRSPSRRYRAGKSNSNGEAVKRKPGEKDRSTEAILDFGAFVEDKVTTHKTSLPRRHSIASTKEPSMSLTFSQSSALQRSFASAMANLDVSEAIESSQLTEFVDCLQDRQKELMKALRQSEVDMHARCALTRLIHAKRDKSTNSQ